MAHETPQILIVGAGPSGLMLALCLLKNGIPVRIIEKASEQHKGIFRGSGITPRTLEVERFLGVLDDVQSLAIDPPITYVYDLADSYRVVKTFPMVQEVEPTPAFPITKVKVLGQSRHQEVLRKHLEALGGQIEFNTEFSGLQQDDNGVTVTLIRKSGENKSEETSRFAYVVGADGGKSSVRKSLGLDFLGETKDFSVLLADVRIEGFDGTGVHKWGEPPKTIATLDWHGEPQMYQLLAGGSWFDIKAVLEDGSVEKLQSEFVKCTQRTDIKIVEIVSMSEWRPNIRMATRFRSGRVFLSGDAAHTHPPTGGQGLNSSIMDAFNLGWKLALVLKGKAGSAVLDSYEAERMPVIAEMLKLSTALLGVANSSNANTQEAFQRAQKAAQVAKEHEKELEGKGIKKPEWTRGWRLFQLDLNYRFSPIVLDERFADSEENLYATAYGVEGHDLRAGDRAPDAPGLQVLNDPDTHPATTRLFDIFTPTLHTVLVFASSASKDGLQALVDSVLHIISGPLSPVIRTVLVLPNSGPALSEPVSGVDFVLKDNDGHAFANYGLSTEEQTIVVVRPDDFVGTIATSVEGVQKYFSTVFDLNSAL